mgnify:CR=1 FL=1
MTKSTSLPETVHKMNLKIVCVRFDASKGIVDAKLPLTHPKMVSANELLALMLLLNSWRSECEHG